MTGKSRGSAGSAPLLDDAGQSTVEYAVVAAGFIALVVGLGAVSEFLQDGTLARHAAAAASHAVGASLGGVVDVFCF